MEEFGRNGQTPAHEVDEILQRNIKLGETMTYHANDLKQKCIGYVIPSCAPILSEGYIGFVGPDAFFVLYHQSVRLDDWAGELQSLISDSLSLGHCVMEYPERCGYAGCT